MYSLSCAPPALYILESAPYILESGGGLGGVPAAGGAGADWIEGGGDGIEADVESAARLADYSARSHAQRRRGPPAFGGARSGRRAHLKPSMRSGLAR